MFSLTVKIAWASLVRRRARSFMVVLMIALSLWGLLFLEGIYDGMTEQMIHNAIRIDCGHLSIFGQGYRLDPDLHKQIGNSATIGRVLQHDKCVRSYTQRLQQTGLVSTAHAARAASIYGVTLADEERQCRLSNYLYPRASAENVESEYTFGSRQHGALIGYKLAEELRVKVGSKLVFSAQNLQGELQSMGLKVAGVLKSNHMLFDDKVIFISADTARNFLGLANQVSQIAILLHDETQASAVQQELLSKFPRLEILRWDQLYPALLQSRQMMKVSNMVISILIFCAVSLGIIGVMLVSVLERLREFGMMQAVGTSFGQIRNIVMMESLLLGGGGFVLGAILGGITLVYFRAYGLDLSVFSTAFEEFGMDAVTYAIIRPAFFANAALAVLMSVLVSVLLPLRVLKRSSPIEIISKL